MGRLLSSMDRVLSRVCGSSNRRRRHVQIVEKVHIPQGANIEYERQLIWVAPVFSYKGMGRRNFSSVSVFTVCANEELGREANKHS